MLLSPFRRRVVGITSVRVRLVYLQNTNILTRRSFGEDVSRVYPHLPCYHSAGRVDRAVIPAAGGGGGC
jgi:hypothetical protein